MNRIFKNSRAVLSAGALALMLFVLLLSACSKKQIDPKPPGGDGGDPDTNPSDTTTVITPFDVKTSMGIDRSQKFQQIDGFGFFGAQGPWWSSADKLYSDAWGDQVINDLGITIWRNEYYPPGTDQDATWDKQKPVVQGLDQVAKTAKVPLKFIFTVWSPPADLKCAVDANNAPISGTPHPGGTKNGGALDPAKYTDYGNWLAAGIQNYKDIGINVYAISPQNEPLFVEPYNSCYYNNVDKSYPNMLKGVIPVVKAKFPDVKVFAAEDMLELEAGADKQWFYNTNIKSEPTALSNMDIWAMHGYVEGISPTSGAKLQGLWNTIRTDYTIPTQKPAWMTETSGYGDTWTITNNKPGAMDLASDIQSALYYGQASAWLWWQGSDTNINDFSLMAGSVKGKKYYVSKHFYRFIRPGSKMVKLDFNSTDKVTASAFENTVMNAFTIVLINPTDKSVKVNLTGTSLPDSYDFYYTTAAVDDNCKKKDAKVGKGNIVLPPSSVVTLVNGNVYEKNN
jgi:glucuronoarabinoxylan endo-1,4-beta-xylanase